MDKKSERNGNESSWIWKKFKSKKCYQKHNKTSENDIICESRNNVILSSFIMLLVTFPIQLVSPAWCLQLGREYSAKMGLCHQVHNWPKLIGFIHLQIFFKHQFSDLSRIKSDLSKSTCSFNLAPNIRKEVLW